MDKCKCGKLCCSECHPLDLYETCAKGNEEWMKNYGAPFIKNALKEAIQQNEKEQDFFT